MNILIINYEFPPLGGGGGVFTRDLAEGLVSEGHRADVLTTHFKGLKTEETINGVNIYRVRVINRASLHSATLPSLLSFPFPSIIKGVKLMRKTRYDVISTHFAVPTGPTGTVLSFFSGIPNFLSILGGDIFDPTKRTSPHRYALLRMVVRAVMNRASGVIAESTDVKNKALKYYSPSKEISIIPLGIRSPEFTPITSDALPVNKPGLNLISIGRLIKRKGYDLLIRALGILLNDGLDVNLILIGNGPEKEALEELSTGLKLSENVVFLSDVSDEKKFQYLSASDIFVLSSVHEGFGLVVLEAMTCGLPVIATNNGGQTDIITDGENGILIPPSDEKALADAIALMAKDPELRKNMSLSNKSLASKYSVPSVVKQYLTLFNGGKR